MNNSYTQAAKERCYGLIDNDLDAIWEGIDTMPTDSKAERWIKKLQSIAKEYTYSSRFALMRILQNRWCAAKELIQQDPSVGFSVELHNGIISFEDISIEHAKNLSVQEIEAYTAVLTEMARMQKDANARTGNALIKKALIDVQVLSRRDALKLGHILGFSISEMEWFLLRVCDAEGGFHFNKSEDLIEAYVFLTNGSYKDVEKLRDTYDTEYRHLEKTAQDIHDVDWTLSQECSLVEMVEHWKTNYNGTKDEQFLLWLKEITPYLGRNSQTALRLYRNLVAFAYDVVTGREFAPDVDTKKANHPLGKPRTDFYNAIRNILCLSDLSERAKALLYNEGGIDSEFCNEVAKVLHRYNADAVNYRYDAHWRKAWATLKVNPRGKLDLHHAYRSVKVRVPDEHGQYRDAHITVDRIADILQDKAAVEKYDMLYLIWFISYQCWYYGRKKLDTDEVQSRMNDFCDIACDCLEVSGHEFYPPHMMEQAALISIARAYSRKGPKRPEIVYARLCRLIYEMDAKYDLG